MKPMYFAMLIFSIESLERRMQLWRYAGRPETVNGDFDTWILNLRELQKQFAASQAQLAAVQSAVELLRQIQWSASNGLGGERCPMCGRHSTEGHNAVCRLAALLVEAK